MHLTNVAIQKKNEKYDENTGMKWPISKLKQYLLSKYGLAATSKLFGDIQVTFYAQSIQAQCGRRLVDHCIWGSSSFAAMLSDKLCY